MHEARLAPLEWKGGGREVLRGDALEHHGGALLRAHPIGQRHQPVGGSQRVLRVRAQDVDRRHAVARSHRGDAGAHGLDRAGCFGAERPGKRELVEPGPLVDLDEVEPDGLDPQQRLPRAGRWTLELVQAEHAGIARLVNADGFHGILVGGNLAA